MGRRTRATIEDLYRVPDNAKAELVDGEVVLMPPTGDVPGYAGDAIVVSLWDYCRRTGYGQAVGDNKGFRVDLPDRGSFSPDAAFWDGPPAGMKFFEGAPRFAVEVRSEGDYGPAAERAPADKRADYFAAGTLVVWDVDLLAEEVVRVYRSTAPTHPTVYRRGEVAEAEPAVPVWRLPVDDLFQRRTPAPPET
jgi:Uma2 family endonuclease